MLKCVVFLLLFWLGPVQAVGIPSHDSERQPLFDYTQDMQRIKKGALSLKASYSAYSYEQCQYPTVIGDFTPEYGYLPPEAKYGVWSYGLREESGEPYLCYQTALTDDHYTKSVITALHYTGMTAFLNSFCGADTTSQPAGDYFVTFELPVYIFPDDCVLGE